MSSKLLDNMDKLLQSERYNRSIELFNKPDYELQIAEIQLLNQYIHDLNNPIWKPVIINGKDSGYKISNTGILLNKKSHQVCPTTNHKGYCQISIVYDKNKRITTSIHRLVAQAFIPNPENKPQVNHKNSIKTCNWVGNLEWNTAKENIQHAITNNLVYRGIGEKTNANIYTNAQIHAVCKLLEKCNYHNTDIFKMTGVDASTVSKIKCKEEWVHISSNYNIPIPVKNATGESAAASKYKEKDIHEVCRLLEKGIEMTDISRSTGVGYAMIYRIKKGLNWKEISSKYNINGNPDSVNINNLE